MTQAVSSALLVVALQACSPFKPACTAADLARLEEDYQTSVALCERAPSCNRSAVDEVFRRKREAWVRCE